MPPSPLSLITRVAELKRDRKGSTRVRFKKGRTILQVTLSEATMNEIGGIGLGKEFEIIIRQAQPEG